MGRVHHHRCPKCRREFRCPHTPSTTCMDPLALHCERCPAPSPSEGPCHHREKSGVPGLAGHQCTEPAVMSDFFHVRRSMTNLAGRQMSSEGFDELGFCAFHAPEIWKREHGIPLDAKRNMSLAGQWTHLRFDVSRKVLVATILSPGQPQEQFESTTLQGLEEQISARFGA